MEHSYRAAELQRVLGTEGQPRLVPNIFSMTLSAQPDVGPRGGRKVMQKMVTCPRRLRKGEYTPRGTGPCTSPIYWLFDSPATLPDGEAG